MKCSQCSRPAIVAVGPEKVPLCVSCHHTFVQSFAIQSRQNQRLMNFLMDQVGQISGIPQPIPFPETPIVNDYGTKMLNNINISNSTVGVVNTGTIQAVDVAITSLNQEGNSEVAEALRALSQSILDSSELQSAKKKQALELLDAVSAEAVAPATEGRSAVVRPLMVELANVVSGIAALEVLAAKYIPLIISFFGG